MSRRLATIGLHWSVLVLLMLLLASGVQNSVLAWCFALAGAGMVGLALFKGLMNGPGPKLQGGLRRAHPWMSRAMYAMLAYASISVILAALGVTLPGPDVRTVLIALFGTGLLHGVFHLWRTTALNDGALRRMLP